MPKYNFKQALKNAIEDYTKPSIFGVFMVWATILVVLNSNNIGLPSLAMFLSVIILDLYLLAMVISNYKVHGALEIIRTQLWFYILLYVAILLFFAPVLISLAFIYVLRYFTWITPLFNIILSFVAIIGAYAVFIRLYLIAPLLAVKDKKAKLPDILIRAWRISKKHSTLLITATTVAVIFVGVTAAAPMLLPTGIYTFVFLTYISSITLPIAKIMLANIGLDLLKKEIKKR